MKDSWVRVGSAVVARVLEAVAPVPRVTRPLDTPLDEHLRSARSVLVIAIDEIGDAVLLSPFLRVLRSSAPGAQITLVTQPSAAPLFEACPYVDRLHRYDPRTRRLLRPLVLPLRARRFARRSLRTQQFDLAVVPRWDVDQHLATAIALFSGATRRLGYSERVEPRKRSLNAGFDRLLTDIIPDVRAVHEVERSLDVLRFAGARAEPVPLEAWLTEEDRSFARARMGGAGVYIAFGIGARDSKRRWPLELFAQLGQRVQGRSGANIVIVGGPDDAQAERWLRARLPGPVTGLCGTATLRQSAAVLQQCQLFVGNDSAPLHLAAAARIPVVEISCHPRDGLPNHNNSPGRFHPWMVPSVVHQPARAVPPCDQACSAGDAHCIGQIGVEQVFDSVTRFLPPDAGSSPLLLPMDSRSEPAPNCG